LQFDENYVKTKCDYFIDVQLWPLKVKLNPDSWLTNFNDSEKVYAIQLLNSFLYFSELLVDQLFIAAFHSISNEFLLNANNYSNLKSRWSEFKETVIVTYVTGENPNSSDSGLGFARRARQLLGIAEERILTPEQTLEVLQIDSFPVLLVDDFVGSGSQFYNTWIRNVKLENDTISSFQSYEKLNGGDFYYCPILCTNYGHDNIMKKCGSVKIFPAHFISNRYSVFDKESYIWPPAMLKEGIEFLRNASSRAGIPSDKSENDWRGFHELGLTISFYNSVPDATLPIFYWDKNGWKPLIKRT